jgi:hypothetical protein
MSALRSVAALCRVPVPHACAAPSHPRSLVRAFWQQAAVRSGPCQRLRAGFSTSALLPPLFPSPQSPQRQTPRRFRGFRHLTHQPNNTSQSTTATRESPPPAPSPVASITNAEQRRRDWAIVRRLAVHIWPKDDWGTRGRVVLGVGLLIGGKVRHNSVLIRALYV